ncbi:MAG: hypothetical protein KA770_00230 [Shewanella sp.]|nr:hypothetical protein [Shewanella sp.]
MDLDPQTEAQLSKIYDVSSNLDGDTEAKLAQIYGVDTAPKGQDMGEGRAALQGFNSTVPYGNRITAGLGALGSAAVTGENVSDLYNEARLNQQTTSEANPKSELAGGIAGIAATLPIGISKAVATTPILGTTANALSKAATATGNFVRGGEVASNAGKLARIGNLAGQSARSALVAAPVSALYGAGAAPEGQQIEGAASGARMGTAFGAAIPVAAAGIGGAIGYGADKVAAAIGKRSGEISKESLSAPLQKVYDRLRSDYPDQAEFESVLASLGSNKDKALIQSAGQRTTNLGKGAAQYPSGEAKSTEFFTRATDAAPDKLKSSLAKTVSPSTNYSSDVDSLLESGRAKAAPLYNDAFKINQQVQSPVIDKILQTPEGKTALNEAVANMQNEMARVAKPDPELTQMAREIGLVAEGGVGRGLKLKTLDYIKRSMDDTIKTAIRAGDDGQVRRITALKNSLVGEIDSADKSGLYAKARSTSGDYLSTKQAMEDGLNFLKDDSENISRRMSNMGKAEKDAYRAGVVKVLRNDIDNKYDGQNVARLFDKQSNRVKLQSLLSPKDYMKLLDDATATDKIYKLRNEIIGGSPTAGKQIAAQEFQNGLNDIAIDVATGNPIGAGYKAVKRIAGKLIDGISDKSAGEVADILYTKDPKEKYQIIKSLLNESKKDGGGLRATEAGQKLKAFYSISDGLKTLNGNTMQPLR